VLLELTVDPEDLGRVIGKRGATAQSLRTLLRALGTKNDARYNLKIVDNGEPMPHRDRDQAAAPVVPSPSQPTDNKPVADDDDDVVARRDPDSSDSMISKTRKELEELDDLDV
jgi:hypothetical protein